MLEIKKLLRDRTTELELTRSGLMKEIAERQESLDRRIRPEAVGKLLLLNGKHVNLLNNTDPLYILTNLRYLCERIGLSMTEILADHFHLLDCPPELLRREKIRDFRNVFETKKEKDGKTYISLSYDIVEIYEEWVAAGLYGTTSIKKTALNDSAVRRFLYFNVYKKETSGRGIPGPDVFRCLVLYKIICYILDISFLGFLDCAGVLDLNLS